MLSSSRGLILGFIILIQCAISSLAFISANKFRTHQISLLRSKPEFSVVGEEELPDTDIQEPDTDGFYVVKPSTGSPSTGVRPEYGALSVGTVVQVQVGDVSLARKAWKKRRRTGSPLLVPCSILNVDRGSMVRWNFMFLLEKFGRARSDGIEISTTELSKKYRTFLKSSMQKQAQALDFDSTQDLVAGLFTKNVQEAYGVRLLKNDDDEAILKAPISRTKAQKRAARTPLLQFRTPKQNDYGDERSLTHTGYLRAKRVDSEDSADKMPYQFLPLSAALRVSQKDDVVTGRVEEGSVHAAVVFDFDPIGDGGSPLLTLSLNPRGVRESIKVKPDRRLRPVENPRHLFHDLTVGDGPYKAKVLRLQGRKAIVDMDVGRRVSSDLTVKVLGALPFKDSVVVESYGDSNADSYDGQAAGDYSDGDGTTDAIESALFEFHDDEDFADDDIEDGENMLDELFSLRDSDSFEEGTFEDGEIEEDISESFEMNEDGTLTYTDPSSGEVKVLDTSDEEEDDRDVLETDVESDGNDDGIDMSSLFATNEDGTVAFVDPDSGEILEVSSDDEEFEDMVAIKSLIDKYSRPPSPLQVDYTHTTSEPASKSESAIPSTKMLVSKRLRVGDEIDVYVRTVSKQSSQFTVTTNPLIQGRKPRDLKSESEAEKKLKRLKKKFGGSLKKIWDMEGEECEGVVKACSKSGDWFYVQPSSQDLPVGVATPTATDVPELSVGDVVKIRISGIDEKRGQLALELIAKI